MKKKMLSLLLALAMVCSMVMPAFAAEETAQYTVPADVSGKLVILHTNDVHGADVAVPGTSIGTAGVAQLKKDFEAAGADVLLLSAGDAIMGKPLVSESKGAAAIEFMNAAGYDAMTVGNHEMDFGYDNLKSLAKEAKFPILGANVLDAKTGKPVFDASKIFTTESGLKVGVFGLATPETLTKADASKMPGITFPQNEELYKLAQAQVDQLKKDGADIIVCLGHLGVDEESVPNRSVDLVNNVTGIDLFVDGHSHTEMNDGKPVKAESYPSFDNESKTLIVSTGTALANVGVVVYDKDAKTLTPSLVSAKVYSKVDADVAKLINDKNETVVKKYDVPFAKTETNLNGTKSGGTAKSTKGVEVSFPAGQGNRTGETNLGDFATDAMLWQAKKTLGADKVDAALTNGGGIRETLSAGDISMLDMLAVFPFGNTVATIQVTGAELLEALEAASYANPEAQGGFAQVSGITYIINTAVPYEKGAQYPGSTYYAPANPGARVTIATVGDKVWDAESTYTIATNDFTAKGGDTYGVFKRVGGWADTGVALEDALINYTKEELKGVITAEQYGQPQGRIAVIPMDVAPDAWYAEAVYFNILMGAMNGTDKGFEPSGTLTRAQVVQILYNLAGRPTEGIDKAAFNDLTGKWYADAAHWAAFVGIVSGKADGSFGGDDPITRAETASIIALYAAASDITVDTSGMAMKEAPDYAEIPADYLDGMTFCYYADIMTGDQNHNLNPNATLTRAEMAQLMYNFAQVPMPIGAAA